MNRSFWITLIVSAAVCITAVMVRVAKTRNLEQRLVNERAKVLSKSEREPEAPDSPLPEPSKEKVDRALAQVIELQPNVLAIAPLLAKPNLDTDDWLKVDSRKIESEYLKIFPDFLRSVEGLSVEELIAVAKGIPDPDSENSLLKPRTKSWLLLLAAEQDPVRIYRDEALMASTSEREILETLGREDPAAALRLLPPMKKETSEPDSSGIRMKSLLGDWALAARIRCGTRLLGSDLDRGLEVLSEVHENYLYIPEGIFGTLGNTPLPDGAIPGLIDAMGNPDYAEMRDDLIEMTLRETIFKGGVAAAAQRVETMQLTEDELNTAIDNVMGKGIMEADPVAVIDWMAEIQPDKVPSAVVKWANQDLQGATTWLGELEPSPLRDRAVAQFARNAARLDREAAAQWVNEIQDEGLREDTLREVEKR